MASCEIWSMQPFLNKSWNSLSAAAGLVIGLISTSINAEEVDVYLLSGQSNMQGIGLVSNLPSDWQGPLEGAWFWNGSDFETLEPGKTRSSTREGEFGPEVGLARTLLQKEPSRPFYLIKFYRSGQPLDPGWNGYQWAGDPAGPNRANFYPGLTQDDPNQGKHYQAMMEMYRKALERLVEDGKIPVIRGMAWMQGEQDSKNAISAGRYAHNLRRLRERIRQDLNSEPFPLVFGQVLPYTPAMERFTHRMEIREQMRRLDERTGCLESEPGIRMISTDGFELKPDTVHYTAKGLMKLGAAFGENLDAMTKSAIQN